MQDNQGGDRRTWLVSSRTSAQLGLSLIIEGASGESLPPSASVDCLGGVCSMQELDWQSAVSHRGCLENSEYTGDQALPENDCNRFSALFWGDIVGLLGWLGDLQPEKREKVISSPRM
ncbi:unnamed protein product [Prorocentrum cordatum]|uniref:Phospholipase B-like n=1 Tax=Prorocentrum cordatum TaxID=2364126 RepID=A0ABN9TD63_9DINO|nr:unnamed protein product [Polarella glacialis]